MEVQRKALYNSLRMNWIEDPSISVEKWQVEDLRSLPEGALFEKINKGGVPLDKTAFLNFASNFDSPEDVTEELLSGLSLDTATIDKLYLAIFEVWRRFFPEKQTLSLFCDELDHQIHLYDTGKLVDEERFRAIIDELLVILNDNADAGLDPYECMEVIRTGSANDIEDFLYDFISDQIDKENYVYAKDLIDGFLPFVHEIKWFDFLKLRLNFLKEGGDLEGHIQELVKGKGQDLDFYFEILSFLSKHGTEKCYAYVVKKMLPLFKTEEDFLDFLSITADFYHFLDLESKENRVLELARNRNKALDSPFTPKDFDLIEVKKLIF